MAGRRILYLVTLAGCLVFYVFYQEWASWLLLLAVAGLPWLSLVISLPGMATFRMWADLPARLELGDRLTARLQGACALPHPPAKARLQLKRTVTGENWLLRPGDTFPAEHCGTLTATPVRARVYDYLGLFRWKLRRTVPVTVVVWPEPVKLAVPPDLERYLARAWRPKFGGGYAENHELRLYRPGDSLNQVHWKLSAKTGKLILREPMEPQRGLMLLTMDVSGTGEELDRKFGRLLWLGTYLLEKNIPFQLRVLTGKGLETFQIPREPELNRALEELLGAEPAPEGSVRDHAIAASWQYHIGGEPDEA